MARLALNAENGDKCKVASVCDGKRLPWETGKPLQKRVRGDGGRLRGARLVGKLYGPGVPRGTRGGERRGGSEARRPAERVRGTVLPKIDALFGWDPPFEQKFVFTETSCYLINEKTTFDARAVEQRTA